MPSACSLRSTAVSLASPWPARCWARSSDRSPPARRPSATDAGPVLRALGGALLPVGRRLRPRPDLGVAADLQIHWRSRHRRLLSGCADVHRGNLARPRAGPTGGAQPVQRGCRDSRCLLLELHHRDDPGRRRNHGMAMDARHRGRARRAVLRVPAAHPRKPALAGQAASPRRSGRRAPHHGHRDPGRCRPGHRRLVARGNRVGARTLLPAEVSASRSSWRSWSRRSTSSPASTR